MYMLLLLFTIHDINARCHGKCKVTKPITSYGVDTCIILGSSLYQKRDPKITANYYIKGANDLLKEMKIRLTLDLSLIYNSTNFRESDRSKHGVCFYIYTNGRICSYPKSWKTNTNQVRINIFCERKLNVNNSSLSLTSAHGQVNGLCLDHSYIESGTISYNKKGIPISYSKDEIADLLHMNGNTNCGGHFAPSCGKCPNKNGSRWCNGDCVWVAETKQCIPIYNKTGSHVNVKTNYLEFFHGNLNSIKIKENDQTFDKRNFETATYMIVHTLLHNLGATHALNNSIITMSPKDITWKVNNKTATSQIWNKILKTKHCVYVKPNFDYNMMYILIIPGAVFLVAIYAQVKSSYIRVNLQ